MSFGATILMVSRDDEFVSEAALQQSSPGVTPLLSGFHYISKLFRSEW